MSTLDYINFDFQERLYKKQEQNIGATIYKTIKIWFKDLAM